MPPSQGIIDKDVDEEELLNDGSHSNETIYHFDCC
jgi:hypothetical protein